MSGVCVDADTRFVTGRSRSQLTRCAHYMKLAYAAYGLPFYMLETRCALLRCCCCWSCLRQVEGATAPIIVEESSCPCNFLGLRLLMNKTGVDRLCQLVYVNYHDGVSSCVVVMAGVH